MQSKATTVDAYLEEQPAERRAVLAELRVLIRKTLPKAAECMRYGMACYDLGEPLCGLAAQKNNFALYLMDTAVVERHRPKLGKLSTGKGCIRFKKIEDLPLDVVRQMLKEAGKRRADGVTSKPCDGAP